MFSGSDWLSNVFLFTFLFGLFFTAVSLALGLTHIGGLDTGHHAHIHVGGHNVHVGHQVDIHAQGQGGHAHAEIETDGPGIFNMPTIMAFLTWFGGAGYLFSRSLPFGGFVLIPLAVLSGLTGGAIMFALLSRLLWPMMSKPMSTSDYQLPGTPARVVSSIRSGGVGEIVYTKGGTRFTAGARSVTEQPVEKGAEVVILRYERGLAYVQSVESLLSSQTRVARRE